MNVINLISKFKTIKRRIYRERDKEKEHKEFL